MYSFLIIDHYTGWIPEKTKILSILLRWFKCYLCPITYLKYLVFIIIWYYRPEHQKLYVLFHFICVS